MESSHAGGPFLIVKPLAANGSAELSVTFKEFIVKRGRQADPAP
jgi:hypothetical protein